MRALRPLLLGLVLLTAWFALRGPDMRAEFAAFRDAMRVVLAGERWALRWPGARPAAVPPTASAPEHPPPSPPAARAAPARAPGPAVPQQPLVAAGPPRTDATDAAPAAALALAWPPGTGGDARGRWSLSVWSLVRASGLVGPGVSPVLGGGQSGLTLAFAPDRNRPLALIARLTAPHRGTAAGAQAALGLRWRPIAEVTLDAERLLPLGPAARDAWTLRAAGGAATAEVEHLRFDASVYGEAGVVGARARDLYAAGLGHVGLAAPVAPGLEAGAGIGVWGSVQRAGGATLARLDVGPEVRTRLRVGPGAIRVIADYRWRLAGDAEPGSGPALTVAVDF